jgi:hypothetical protein
VSRSLKFATLERYIPYRPAPPIEDVDFLATDSSTPYEWDIPGSEVGKDIWYRGAWETPRGEIGQWSDPAKGTVTG